MRSDNEREVGTQLLVARNGVSPGTCWDGRDGRGEDGLGSERSRNVQRLADVLEGRQELLKQMTERDQGLISDELWNHITVRRRRRSMSLGGTSSQLVDGRTDEGSFEDLEDRESTKWRGKVVADFGPHSESMDKFRKGWRRGNIGQSTAINNGTEK